MTVPYSQNIRVKWQWGQSWVTGKIVDVVTPMLHDDDVNQMTLTTAGDSLSYLIEQDDGGRVLLPHRELTPVPPADSADSN